MNDRHKTAECGRCGRAFRYLDAGRRRRLCPACLRQNLAAALRRVEARRKTQGRTRLLAPALFSRAEERGSAGVASRKGRAVYPGMRPAEEVAAQVGLTATTVDRVTRVALARIRAHPELRQLWRMYAADGAGGLPAGRPDAGAVLLDYQQKLADWQVLYFELVTAELPEEAAECLQVLEQFQKVVAAAVREIAGTRPERGIEN